MPNEKTAAAPSPSKGRIFFRRLFSFLVLWSVILAALFSGSKVLSDCVFLVVMILLAVSGLLEFYGIAEKSGLVCFRNSKYDLFKGPNGDIYVLPKNGAGFPQPTGVNIQ